MTAKSGPDVVTLAFYAPLYKALAKICPSGVLNSGLVKDALQGLQRKNPINLDTEFHNNLSAFYKQADGFIRMGFSKYRDVMQDAKKIHTVNTKASEC